MAHDRPLVERLRLIVITDPASPHGPLNAARAALRAGAPALQVRWKGAGAREIMGLATDLREATSEAGALLFVNDRLDVAVAAGADGVHLGQDDLPLRAARQIAPPGFLIGISVDTPGEAVAAEAAGADYVGVGPIYLTATKNDAGPVLGPEGVRPFRERVAIPIVAIGGIGPASAASVIQAGADGVAVIGAVMFADDPGAATNGILREIRGD